MVWLGVVVAGVAAVLWVAGGLVHARSRRRTGAAPQPTLPGTSRPQVGPGSSRGAGRDPLDEDQDDIEAILRKHGIS
jgi:hypothetical protein